MPCVLVVDDDETTGDAIRRLLGRMGYSAQYAPGGPEAIESLQSSRPDLIVLDWMMPEMNGLDVLRRLRADPATQDLPVIIYTALSSPTVAKQAADHGAQDCVLKSGGFFPLYDSIQRHVQAQQ
jgi:CheY-like chemotaxis protein